jgi:hypothetical protein
MPNIAAIREGRFSGKKLSQPITDGTYDPPLRESIRHCYEEPHDRVARQTRPGDFHRKVGSTGVQARHGLAPYRMTRRQVRDDILVTSAR